MRPIGTIVALGTAQTIAWASSYYMPAILAAPIARDLGVTSTVVFGSLSGALVIAGLIGPRVGHAIDTFGGGACLPLPTWASRSDCCCFPPPPGRRFLIAAWIALGLGMGLGLYEAAFATLTRIYGSAARRPITGITLIAGFASTVGWPFTSWLDAHFGWRIACQIWAGIHIVLALPLNLALPRAANLVTTEVGDEAQAPNGQSETFQMAAVAYVFAATGFVSSGMSAIMPALLVLLGATPSAALFAGMLIGPSQVGARILEAGWLTKYHPLLSARLATLTNPFGVVSLAIGGPGFSPLFAIFYGAGNGILTIARGTLPLALFGPRGFGRRVGMISLPARAAGAFAPLAIGMMFETIGVGALWVCAGLSLSAFAALMLLRAK